MGILVALIERSKSGKGQVVDANLVSRCAKKKEKKRKRNRRQ
jgi:crotonobetainyl-CoA:carnitine CoA-transferase CaiB-like acyl-CoA transferase